MIRFFAGLLSFVAIVVLAVMAVPFFISSDWVRQQVVAEVEAKTGLRLALDGDVSLSVFPSLALRARNVGLSNGRDSEFARVGEFRFGLSLPALLSKTVAVTALELSEPKISLAVDAEGRSNWLPVKATNAPAPAEGSSGSGFGFSIARFMISDGNLVWSDARSGSSEVISDISLQSSLKDLNAPLKLTGGLTARGLPVQFDIALTSLQSLIAQQSATIKLSLASGDTKVTSEGVLTPGATPLFEGPTSLASDDLASLFKTFGLGNAPLKSLAVDGALSVSTGRVEMTGLNLASDIASGNGEFALSTEGEKPRIDARLSLGTVNLDALAAGDESGNSDAGQDAPIDLAPLSALDAGLDLKIASLEGEALGPAGALADVHVVSVIDAGKLTVVLDPVSVGRGTAGGRLVAVAGKGGATISGRLDAAGFELAELAAMVGQSIPVRGLLSAKVDFSATGKTKSALIAGLDASGEIGLTDGSVAGIGLAEALGDPAADSIDNIALTAAFSGLAEPVHISGHGRFLDQAVNADVTVDPRKVLAGGAFPLVAAVDTKRLSISFNGDLAPAAASANGRVEIAAPSLASALKLIGRPAGNLPEGALKIAGNLSASPSHVELAKASIVLGETSVAGKIAVSMANRPRITAELSGKSLDLGVLLAGMSGGNAPGDPTIAKDTGWSDDAIDLSGLSNFDADIAFDISQLRFGAVKTGDVSLGLNLDAGVLALKLPVLSLYKGKGQGTVKLDSQSSPPALSAEFAMNSVDILPFLAATAGTKRVAGTGKVSFSVTTSGQSQRDMVRNLSGKAAIGVSDGALLGIDIPALLRSVATAILNGFGSDKNAVTPFESLSASFAIANGIASNDDLTLKSPVLQISGAGAFDLPNKALSFKVKPVLNAPGAGALDFEVPVVIEGPWSSPRIYPDIAGILDNPQAAFAKLAQLGGVFSKLGSDPGANLGTVLDQLAPGLGKVAGGDQGDLAKTLLGALTTDKTNGGTDDPLGGLLDAANGNKTDAIGGLLGGGAADKDPVKGLIGALAGGALGGDSMPAADVNGVPLPRPKPKGAVPTVTDIVEDPVGTLLDGAGVDGQTQDLLGGLLGQPKKPGTAATDPATDNTDPGADKPKKPKKPKKPAEPSDPVNDLLNGILQ